MELKSITWKVTEVAYEGRPTLAWYQSEEEALAYLETASQDELLIIGTMDGWACDRAIIHCTRENGAWKIERPTYELTRDEMLQVARYVQRYKIAMYLAGNFPERYILVPGGSTPSLFIENDPLLYDLKTIAFQDFSRAVADTLTQDLVDASIQRYLDRIEEERALEGVNVG